MSSSSRHACEVQVTFPTDVQAEQALQILQVDAEPTDRVHKSFRLEPKQQHDGDGDGISVNESVSMVVRFESEELKMLRVAVSSFYDYLAVVLKTMQEFDRTMMMMGSDETTIR